MLLTCCNPKSNRWSAIFGENGRDIWTTSYLQKEFTGLLCRLNCTRISNLGIIERFLLAYLVLSRIELRSAQQIQQTIKRAVRSHDQLRDKITETEQLPSPERSSQFMTHGSQEIAFDLWLIKYVTVCKGQHTDLCCFQGIFLTPSCCLQCVSLCSNHFQVFPCPSLHRTKKEGIRDADAGLLT